MAIDITKGIESFDDRTDFTRGNPDRKPWGKGGTDSLSLGSEYDVTVPPTTTEPEPVVTPVTAPAPKFTHKMANGTVLEAATVTELAALIEKSVAPAPVAAAPLEFEDKPLYTPLEFKPKELTLQQQADILNVWKENPQKAKRMLDEAEYGQPMDEILKRLDRMEMNELYRQQEIAGAEFMGECETYNPTVSNGKKLTALLKEKGKPITKHNLQVAFNQLVAAGDKNLVRPVDAAPAVDDPDLIDSPPPPTIVPSNQGLPSAPPAQTLDAAKFASMSLPDQKKFFADLRRGRTQ
jgi:hypothetical protein